MNKSDRTVICITCRSIICTDCAIDKLCGHGKHNLITSKSIVKNYMEKIELDKITHSKLILKYQTKLNAVAAEKNSILVPKSDEELLLLFANSNTNKCAHHGLNCDAICITCNKLACIKCFVDSLHPNHNIRMCVDQVQILRTELGEKICKLDTKIEKYKNAISFNNIALSSIEVSLSDKKIVNKYIADNEITDNICQEDCVKPFDKYILNEFLDLDLVSDLKLKWNNVYDLITRDQICTLNQGYYMVIAVGGGASGGTSGCLNKNQGYFCNTGGGGSGYVCAKILVVQNSLNLNIKIGLGGNQSALSKTDSMLTSNNKEYCEHLDGGATIVRIESGASIVANGGLTPRLDYYPLFSFRYLTTRFTGTLYGGVGFSGGGSVGSLGGSNGESGVHDFKFISTKLVKSDKISAPHLVTNNNLIIDPKNSELYLKNKTLIENGSGDKIINIINKIFPLIYPGNAGLEADLLTMLNLEKNNNAVYNSIILPGGYGAAGLCLAGYNFYKSNKFNVPLLIQSIHSQGFGAGGKGSTICTIKTNNKTDFPTYVNGSNGLDGCVIIVHLE